MIHDPVHHLVMRTLEEIIRDQEQSLAQARAKLAKNKARLREDERKREMRRVILTGQVIRDAMAQDEALASTVRRLLDQHVTDAGDRKLLGLDTAAEVLEPERAEPAP